MIKLNGAEIKPTIFPDKTSQVWNLEESLFDASVYNIKWNFEHEAEFIHLAQLKELLDVKGAGKPALLTIPYFPYARQDKHVSNNTTFARVTFEKLLKFLDFDYVVAFDLHSPSRCVVSHSPFNEVLEVIRKINSDMIVFPDKGAETKYLPIFASYIDSISANKIRNQETGEITHLELNGNCEGKKCLIVDDICDGGMTFIKLSELLFKNGASEVNLYVSHGLFTKGTQILKDAGINKIFTKDGELNENINN